ncbi:MAG: membrane protein insertion efficiency factor YidD [Proteobacteria bacterium]|nr:MAG: membrane protein insertion efficiency factor YidD [Pseudomonadota bacterium]
MPLIRFLHRAYKLLLSGLFGNVCRFEPYCSDYAMQACETHGIIKGSWLALLRVLRCHPYCRGGFDPVPPKVKAKC